MILSLLLSLSFAHACDYKMGIVPGTNGHEATLRNVTLPKRDAQIICLDVPNVKPFNGFIAFNSINLGNASCSSVKMVVTNPNGEKLEKSIGSQPGTIGKYMPGPWKIRVKLKSGCDKYTFGANW